MNQQITNKCKFRLKKNRITTTRLKITNIILKEKTKLKSKHIEDLTQIPLLNAMT